MSSGPKIVIFDLEILPDPMKTLAVWPRLHGKYSKTLRASVTSICSIGYKIFGQKKTKIMNAWDYPNWEKDVNDDSRLLKNFLKIIDDADALVAHNGKYFDWPYFKTRLIKHKLYLPNIPLIDTRAIAAKHLYVFDNKLDTLGDFLEGKRKIEHEGWGLWVKTFNRDKAAMKKMSTYCKGDVDLLNDIYIDLRPYITNIPNHNLFYDESAKAEKQCPNCGGTRLKSHGWRHTKTTSYRRYRCMNCFSFCRTNKKDIAPRSI